MAISNVDQSDEQRLAGLAWRELAETCGLDGHTWIPRVPRVYALACDYGRAKAGMEVRAVGIRRGASGTAYVVVQPVFAHNLMHCPDMVRESDLLPTG